MHSEIFIQSLINQTEQILAKAQSIKSYDVQTLTWRQDENAWNILECFEHLNLYGDFYLPQIASKIKDSSTKSELVFKRGILGNYFAQSMLPKDKLNKMKTFKDKNPINTNLGQYTIERCIEQQIQLLGLLNQSKKVSLNKVKISTSISRFIKLKLGDAFQFYINHMIRHMKQIENIQMTQTTS